MSLKLSFARTITAAALIVVLFTFSLPAEAKPPASMGEKDVRDTVATLGVGHSVALRISTSAGGGALQFKQVRGHIAAVSSDSIGLSIKHGHTQTVQTYAYKDIDRVDELAHMTNTDKVLLSCIAGGAVLAFVLTMRQIKAIHAGN
jgi:hypothetical protein